MSDPAKLALAEAAIVSGVTGCYEWDNKEAERVRGDPSLQGLTPEYIRERLHEFIRLQGGKLLQIAEKRPEYSHRVYCYKAIIPEPGFTFGFFVELELTVEDPDLPCVVLLNAHPQSR
jgi:hypothetical protein